jgi:hypothetical protein
LVWSGTTETFAPGAGDEDITRLADIIIKALAEKGLIRSEKSCSIALFHPCRHARTVRGIVAREETSHRT